MTPADEWTVLRLLKWSEDYLARKGVESPRLDVELLLAEALGMKRLELYVRFEHVPAPAERERFKRLLRRRAAREPAAYILGRREFYGISFEVGPGVLVPRPETEHLVDAAVEALKGLERPLAADVGTGCGNVAVALASALPAAVVYAVERSPAALRYAARNVEAAGLKGKVRLLEGDLLAPLPRELLGSLDAVVSNPPYVPEGDEGSLPPEVLAEPREALFAGRDGLDVVRRLVREARPWLKDGGLLAFEVGAGQAPAAAELLRKNGFSGVVARRDYAGIERILSARKDDG